MKTLQPTYKKNGFTYKLHERNEHAAIYSQWDGDRFVAYEVGRVKVSKGGNVGGNEIEAGEVFWSNEDFGVIAWTMRDMSEAMAKFKECSVPRTNSDQQ